MMGLGYFKTQTESSTTFGALICVSGIVATPLGGIGESYFMHYRIGSLYLHRVSLMAVQGFFQVHLSRVYSQI